MNVLRVSLRVVVMVLLVSNGLFSMDKDPIERTKSPINSPVSLSEISLAEIEEEIIEEVDMDIAEDLDQLLACIELAPVQQGQRPQAKILTPEDRPQIPQGDTTKQHLRAYDLRLGADLSNTYPLHKAVRAGKIDEVARLCDEGINPLSFNYIGMQPLHYTTWLSDEKSALEIVHILNNYVSSQKRLCANFLNVMKRGSVQEVIEVGKSDAQEVLRFFIPNFQSFPRIHDLEDYFKLMPEFVGAKDPLQVEQRKATKLLNYLESINFLAIPTNSNIMPLTLAIEAKKFALAKKLVELGAPVDVKSDTQQPLLLAIKSGNVEFIDHLLEKGARVTSVVKEYIKDPSAEERKYFHGVKSKLRNAVALRAAKKIKQ